jgi:hypothetical protein
MLHVFDTSDANSNPKENAADEDIEEALEYLPFDLIDDNVVL